MQQQEKLKQKIHDEHQQQHSIVPLTPESVARFLANQIQPQTSDNHPWSIHHSISAPTFPTFVENNYYDTCQSVKENIIKSHKYDLFILDKHRSKIS